jgi:hypothetical protein
MEDDLRREVNDSHWVGFEAMICIYTRIRTGVLHCRCLRSIDLWKERRKSGLELRYPAYIATVVTISRHL